MSDRDLATSELPGSFGIGLIARRALPRQTRRLLSIVFTTRHIIVEHSGFNGAIMSIVSPPSPGAVPLLVAAICRVHLSYVASSRTCVYLARRCHCYDDQVELEWDTSRLYVCQRLPRRGWLYEAGGPSGVSVCH